MAKQEYAIDRVRRFNKLKSVQNANRVDLGLRFSVDELLQLITQLTGKRALLVDEPQGTRPALGNAELALVTSGQPNGGPYRLTVSKVSAEQPSVTNENNDPNSRFNATRYPKATGIAFMVGKGRPTMALTVEDFPIVGEDLRDADGNVLPLWEFITHVGRYAYSSADGGGGTGSKTPPPGS